MSHSRTDHSPQWTDMIQDDYGINETVAVSKYCPLDYCNEKDSNMSLKGSDSQCNYNHSGTLCGECHPGLSLDLGSTQCLYVVPTSTLLFSYHSHWQDLRLSFPLNYLTSLYLKEH